MDKNKSYVTDELLDADLQQMLGNRYSDITELFTPEAQQRRRNNRLMFTLKITAFLLCLMHCINWLYSMTFLSNGWYWFLTSGCGAVIGYNAGVCVSHMKGWRD